MQKSPRAQKQRKAQKVQKAPKKVQKVQKRTIVASTASAKASTPVVAPVRKVQKIQQAQKANFIAPNTLSLPTFSPKLTKFNPLQTTKRNMSVLVGTRIRSIVPCDPRFLDDEVISMLNPKTNMVEPVIVVVPEISFEWVFSSPCDLHTFDVIPVVKDCIDPSNPVFESMDA
jgi:hypothetical protein